LINERTKAVIPVDIAGIPCHYDEIIKLVSSEKYTAMFRPANEIQKKLGRVLVLGDAAHSFGAVYKGRKTGCLADISVFSFHAVKNLTTAEGGAICTGLPANFDNSELFRHFNTMSLHGQSKDALAKVSTGGWKYDIIDCGYKGNMTDIQASLGLVGLKYYDSETIPRRKDIFNKYHNRFKDKKWAILPETSDGLRETSYHIYMLRVNGVDEHQRDLIMQEIAEKEIAVNVHFQPLPLLTAFRTRGYKMEDYPVAYNNYKCEITLPVNEIITDEQVDEVAAAVTEAVKKVTGWS
ncbi:MAG: DegT/DnrJ/EryC1/StrS family aminotransferase, partial [Bacteroidota bacterium]